MKPGQPSQTAVLVCAARAFAHATTKVSRYSDPTALALLPEDARKDLERALSGPPPARGRERLRRSILETNAAMIVVRTLAIDDAIRDSALNQVVILGAGLDGRAWRLPELREAVVFEVDHPDTQRAKRDRVARLAQTAREVRFVPVDFARDDLGQALDVAGHDPRQPTLWIWEGVVMYLSRPEIDATLAHVKTRSAPHSRLVVVYHSPSLRLLFVSFIVRRLGEPLKSAFKPEAMRALLGRFGFAVRTDASQVDLAAGMPEELLPLARRAQHLRVAVAERA